LEKLATNYDIRFLLKNPMRILSFLKRTVLKKSYYTVTKQIKQRHFDIPMAGGFQLTEYIPMIEQYFEIGNQIVVFATLEDLLCFIRYYLARENKRKEIARAGFNRTINQHLMIHRWQEVIKQLKEK